MGDAEWLALLCESVKGPVEGPQGGPLPGFPPVEVQISTVSQSGDAAIRQAWEFMAACIQRFIKSPHWFKSNKTLLDFGTGWGRIARCFLRDFPEHGIFGVDIDRDMIEFCRSAFKRGNFTACNPLPPLELPDASIDFIVSYSVFSHLSEQACKSWVVEFARLLKPGGIVALTTRPRWFFDYAQSLPAESSSYYHRALVAMFPDFDLARAAYDRGEFVHSALGVGGDPNEPAPIYGETFIPERYAREAYADHLTLTEFDNEQHVPILFFSKL